MSVGDFFLNLNGVDKLKELLGEWLPAKNDAALAYSVNYPDLRLALPFLAEIDRADHLWLVLLIAELMFISFYYRFNLYVAELESRKLTYL